MELIAVVVEALLALLDLAGMIVDVVAWIRGRENRRQRKEARRAGEPLPPRDQWNRLVIVLSIVVTLLTLALVLWKFA